MYIPFANDTLDMGLISKIYEKTHMTPLQEELLNSIKKWANDLKRHFYKEDTQRAQSHMKKYSTSLAIREMKIKTTMRYHFTLVRMANITKSTNNKFWQGW